MGKRILTCKIISSFFGYLYESGMEKYKKGTHLTANPFTSMKTKPSDSAEVKIFVPEPRRHYHQPPPPQPPPPDE